MNRTRDGRITYPVEGLAIALDPDIPQQYQKVFFEAARFSKDWRWVLNGVPLARSETAWTPVKRGQYYLELRDAKGIRMDAVHFSVRGGG